MSCDCCQTIYLNSESVVTFNADPPFTETNEIFYLGEPLSKETWYLFEDVLLSALVVNATNDGVNVTTVDYKFFRYGFQVPFKLTWDEINYPYFGVNEDGATTVNKEFVFGATDLESDVYSLVAIPPPMDSAGSGKMVLNLRMFSPWRL